MTSDICSDCAAQLIGVCRGRARRQTPCRRRGSGRGRGKRRVEPSRGLLNFAMGILGSEECGGKPCSRGDEGRASCNDYGGAIVADARSCTDWRQGQGAAGRRVMVDECAVAKHLNAEKS